MEPHARRLARRDKFGLQYTSRRDFLEITYIRQRCPVIGVKKGRPESTVRLRLWLCLPCTTICNGIEQRDEFELEIAEKI